MYPVLLAGFLLFGVCFILPEPEAPPEVPVSTNAPVAGVATMFPLEVMGSDGSTKSFTVHVTNGHLATNLFLKVHGITYPGKMSIRINGGAWTSLNNDNTHWPYKLERASWKMGWLDALALQNPPMATLRFGFPMAPGSLIDGVNTFDFRFNDLNGFTVGYRVLDLNPQASGTNLMSASQKPQDDPLTWTAPPGGDPVAGEYAWTNLVIGERGKVLKAKCSTCHSPSGFDLAYFNYSNESIIQRSIFHDVPPVTATNIAAFIRANPAQHSNNARPWNPPYQPGPGLDALPVYHWAAGAGLENVLDDDLDTRFDIWPGGVITTNYLNLTNIVNARQVRLSMQFPDANHWFPQVAPIDCYDGLENSEFVLMYDQIIAKLNTLATVEERAKYFNSKKSAWDAAGSKMGIPKPPQDDPGYAEWSQKDESMRKWRVWRTFQIMMEYGLQESGLAVFKTYTNSIGQSFPPNNRTWFHGEVFNLSPHKVGRLKYDGFSIQSAMWYQCQVVLNDSQRHNPSIVPIDWGYQHALLVGASNNPESYLLYFCEALNCIKGLQTAVQGLPLTDPASYRYGRERLEYFMNSPEKVGIFNLIPIGLRRDVGNALVLLDLQVAQWFPRADYYASYTPNGLEFYEAHLDYYGPRMTSLGLDPNIVTMWDNWGTYLFDADKTVSPEDFEAYILHN